MKRIVIALGVVALSSASPAFGQTWLFIGSAKLMPADASSSASGSAKLSGQVYYDMWLGSFISGDVSVSCSRLAPNATYLIVMSYTEPWGGRSFAQIASPDGLADGRGNLTITSSWSSGGWGVSQDFDTLDVYRVEPTGIVLVLSGAISYRYKHVRFH